MDASSENGRAEVQVQRQQEGLARRQRALLAFALLAIAATAFWPAAAVLAMPAVVLAGMLVGERSRGLQRAVCDLCDELEHDRDEALAVAANKAQFLANMSHEIRTPMNGVLGMAELLVRTKLDDDQEQMATTIQASADALLNIVNDILDFSKIEAGKLELESVDFDLWQTLDDCAVLLHTNANQKGVELMTYVDPRIFRSHRGDPARLRQILLNFLSNAIKFTLEGEVVLQCDLVEEDDAGQTVRISVRDTGVGIGEAAMAKLFQPFAQADASTTRRFGGTGLGLTISSRLAELMGARIEAESVEGEGSTFAMTVRLPLGDLSLARARAQDVNLEGHAVLIVEDNPTNRRLMVNQLMPTRIGIDVASNAIAAIERLRTAAGRGRPFTMAILDMTMPGIDGLELARAIHNDRNVPHLPIALTSALNERPDLLEMAAADVFRWLNKPLSGGRLLQVVHDMASMRGKVETDRAIKGSIEESLANVASVAGVRVLVAEDNEINRRVLAGMVRKIGCEVTFAVDGREALQIVQQREFDLVLMDCQMPELDGYEASRAIRALGGHFADLPIVALTANVMPADRDACLEAGMNDFLGKPVKLDVLRGAIQRWGQGLTEASV
ncbi:MAG: response regulator [Planctomycetes bacterium]|nr:response regulator [Planctomycetota bacterium]